MVDVIDLKNKKKLYNVLYLTNIPSPYRVSFFNELGKLCNLVVLFERKNSNEREISWHNYDFMNFDGIFLKGIKYKANKALSIDALKYLSDKKFDFIIVGGYATPTGALAISYLKMKKRAFILNIDGGMINNVEHKFKYSIKKWFISSADLWLSTSQVSSSYLEYYGADTNSIYKYPFTSISYSDIEKQIISEDKKMKIKKMLKIPEDKIILAVGSFIKRKGFDTLLKSCVNLESNIGVYIIGGKPPTEYLNLVKSLNLKNIHFLDHKKEDEIKNYYKSSDVFVLPTREDIWGLVVNEAMAYGLPVITTDKCVAGLELIENYENGFIISVDDEKELRKRINEVLFNKSLSTKMSNNNLRISSIYTIENMAKQTINILNETKKSRNGF